MLYYIIVHLFIFFNLFCRILANYPKFLFNILWFLKFFLFFRKILVFLFNYFFSLISESRGYPYIPLLLLNHWCSQLGNNWHLLLRIVFKVIFPCLINLLVLNLNFLILYIKFSHLLYYLLPVYCSLIIASILLLSSKCCSSTFYRVLVMSLRVACSFSSLALLSRDNLLISYTPQPIRIP